jgi:hypothetical protein
VYRYVKAAAAMEKAEKMLRDAEVGLYKSIHSLKAPGFK